MDDPQRDRHRNDRIKYNEFHQGGQIEDRTTAEIVEIATNLENGALIHCVTWLWPHMRLSITLDNRPYELVRDVELVVSNAVHCEFDFKPHDGGRRQLSKNGLWRNGVDMNIVDVVESFGLDDQKIKNPDPPHPGIWTGWFLYHYRGPRSDEPVC